MKSTMRASDFAAPLVFLGCLTAFGQMPQTGPPLPSTVRDSTAGHWNFEVVSIRQDKSLDTERYGLSQYGSTPDGWRMTNGTLALAILTAYVPRDGAAIYIPGGRSKENQGGS